jgi:hypothetical protein
MENIMDTVRNHPEQDPAEGASDIVERELQRAEKDADQRLQDAANKPDEKTVDPDDLPNLDAIQEAVRQHGDVYIVKSDLEDEDQRNSAPGTREQP